MIFSLPPGRWETRERTLHREVGTLLRADCPWSSERGRKHLTRKSSSPDSARKPATAGTSRNTRTSELKNHTWLPGLKIMLSANVPLSRNMLFSFCGWGKGQGAPRAGSVWSPRRTGPGVPACTDPGKAGRPLPGKLSPPERQREAAQQESTTPVTGPPRR